MGDALLYGVLLAGLYLLHCLVWPHKTCGACKGAPKRMALDGSDAWRHCGSCGGSGRKVRLGRKLFPGTPR